MTDAEHATATEIDQRDSDGSSLGELLKRLPMDHANDADKQTLVTRGNAKKGKQAMATATAGKSKAPDLYDDQFLLGIPCEIIGATGPKWSGKSLFGLTIAPGVHPEGHAFAGQPRTLNLDFEKSSGSYTGTGAKREDVPYLLRKKFGEKDYKPIDAFRWFREFVLTIKPGQYDVIMVDPVTDIEMGLMAYVRANPGEFGYTAGQFAKMEAVAIACAKALWKTILADIAARCQTFYFTAHEKREWKGGQPTTKTIAKGLDTLFELSSFYLKLSREKYADGDKPSPPSAEVLKSRLSHTSINAETGDLEIVGILPERIPVATVQTIRSYVRHPVGRRKLKPEEIAQEVGLSDDERKLIELEIATRQSETAAANLSIQERMQQAAERQAGITQTMPQVAPAQAAKPSIGTANGQPAVKLVDAETVENIKAMAKQVYGDDPGQFRAILTEYRVKLVAELTASDADKLSARLRKLTVDKAKRETDRMLENKSPADAGPSAEHATAVDKLRMMVKAAEWTADAQAAWKKAHGYGSFRSATAEQLEELTAHMVEIQAGRRAKDSQPIEEMNDMADGSQADQQDDNPLLAAGPGPSKK